MNHHSTWRPPPTIRPKVIAIAKHENRILVCEILTDEGSVKGWCPLGGGIEFGETAEAALQREIAEELGSSIQILGAPLVCENIFEHHATKGHDIIFAFPVRFGEPQIYAKKRFQIREDKGSLHWVEWVEKARFQLGKETLFPPAIAQKILNL